MSFKDILFHKDGSIATITLNRPASFNALDLQISKEICTVLEACRLDRGIRVVILTGSGKVFCSGGDIKYFAQFAHTDPGEPVRQVLEPLQRIILQIRHLPKPVLAVINGAVGGAGMSLALACDLRLCSSQAKFRQAYTSLGLAPDAGWSLWVGLLAGFSKASEMVFLDQVYDDAHQALAMNLVHKVAAPEELATTARVWAEKLAAGATGSFAIAKENLNQALLPLLERQLEVERQGVLEAAYSEDYQEGLAAFLKKRKPLFKGS